MADGDFQVVKLHDFPELTEEAVHLLNSEWPRSMTARCHSLKNSSDNLPCSLLLIQVSDVNVSKVVGYSHLCRVLQKPKSVLIESVIVDKTLRGCGLGRMIMECTEDFARKLGYETLHLSTHDKQKFYEHLGYKISTAVSPETKVARFLSEIQMENLDKRFHHENSCTNTPVLTDDKVDQRSVKSQSEDTSLLPTSVLQPSLPPSPPLPPPLPLSPPPPPEQLALQCTTLKESRNNREENKIWMRKCL